MVRIIIYTFFCFLSLTHAYAFNSKLALKWHADQSSQCQEIVGNFINELRSMATDREIELEVTDNKKLQDSDQSFIHIKCINSQLAKPYLEITKGSDVLQMHYLEKAKGFDAIDWLPFQKKYLGTQEINNEDLKVLAHNQAAPETYNAIIDETAPNKTVTTLTEAKPIYKKWWFWTVIGGAALSSSYLIYHSMNKPHGIQIEVQ